MDRARSRRLLLLAFAISLLLHVIFVRFLHGARPTQQRDEEIAARMRITHITRLPQATPPPTAQPTSAPNPHRPQTLPHAAATNGTNAGGRVVATPQPVASAPTTLPPATLQPAATPTPCAGRVIPPQVLQTPTSPPIPSDVRAKGTEGVAAIDVTVDAGGKVIATALRTSSGNPGFDDIATQMARESTYAPATNNCAKVAGVATFTAQFFML